MNLIDLGTSRDGPMASTSAVVQDAGVDVQTAVQHFWTLLSMLLGILPIRKLRTRSIIIFFTHQRTSEGIIMLMISQRKMIIGGRKGSECSLNSENSLTSALNTSVRSSHQPRPCVPSLLRIWSDKANASHMDLKTGFPQSTEASSTALRHARTLTENTAVSSRVGSQDSQSRGAVETLCANPEPKEVSRKRCRSQTNCSGGGGGGGGGGHGGLGQRFNVGSGLHYIT